MHQQLPVQYLVKEPGHNYSVNKKSMGFGKKSDFTKVRPEQVTPGPKYNDFIKQSISYKSQMQSSQMSQAKGTNTFFNGFDKYDKICYKGMEKHFYMRETVGPGHYMSNNTVLQSFNPRASQFSVPKNDRKLLTQDKESVPAAAQYNADKLQVQKKQPSFTIGRQSRDVAFSKYSALHSELVRKGLN